ncbi:MAG: acyltransferase [SAR86 cluster bacterium]|uniref:Acyltransferase n=1 Tax=SAR86 cluster bacterium TaxID=2030880 RepID=A0A2A5CA29_9GAMM|nr:MAG: acyltransferase [SAR86 cluster bacterium]
MEELKPSSVTRNDFDKIIHLGFRPDIQGLRALAILLVVFSHASIPGFLGGFIGVDIFFVLSGYLITGLLIKEVQTSNKINFLQFYSRRFKRLLPALITVVIATLLLAYFILAPFEQLNQAKAAYSVPLWLSNFYFSFADFNYFAPEADNSLFLHTWSLAVEEQFYLVWPLLLFLLLFKTHGDTKPKHAQYSTHNLRIGLICIFLFSFILGIYWSYAAPTLAFYLMPGRGWQFALGGIIFLLIHTKTSCFHNKNYDQIFKLAGPLGLACILLALLYLDEKVVYPGFHALLPSLGTGLILLAGASNASQIITRTLSRKWMQKIGDLSYSWYLWHWPILVLGGVIFPSPAMGLNLSLIIISLLLAQITYTLIESPLRHLRLFSIKPALTVCASFVLMLSALFIVKTWETKVFSEAQNPQQITFLEVRSNLPMIYQSGCDDWYQNARVLACVFGDQNAEHTAVLIGDSVGAQWFSGLATPLINAGWRFIVYTKSSCPIVDESIYYDRIGMIYEVCQEWRDNVLSNVNQFSPDLIFIGNSAEYDYTTQQWNEGTQRVLTKLTPALKHLFIIPGTHNLPFDGPGCLARKSWQPDFLAKITSCTYQPEINSASDMMAGISLAAASFSNVSLLDLNAIVCPNGICKAEANNEIVYRDNQHLTDQFVSSHRNEIAAMIQAVHPF